MMEKLEDTLSAMEGKVALQLERIEHRLDSMEQLVGSEIVCFFFFLPCWGPAGQKVTEDNLDCVNEVHNEKFLCQLFRTLKVKIFIISGSQKSP